MREYASLVGRVNVDLRTGKAQHKIVDRGTCHQTANLNLGPGTDMVTVFGPLFVLPFNTTVVGASYSGVMHKSPARLFITLARRSGSPLQAL